MTTHPGNEHGGRSDGIHHVRDLFRLHGADFISAVYETILKRPPDAEGAGFYLLRLQEGSGKERTIAEIASSPEARARAVDLPGLRDLIAGQEAARHWLRKALSGNRGSERQLNRLEYELGTLAQQLAESNRRLGVLERAIQALQLSLASPHATADGGGLITATVAPGQSSETEPDKFSPAARRILAELSRAIAGADDDRVA